MISSAGKLYERSKCVNPFSKERRQSMYSSRKVDCQVRISEPKYSPFITVPRSSRDSYLLRVTQEPNPQIIYQPNYATILKQSPRPTIDKAKFIRFIGLVRQPQTQQIPSSNRCQKSVSPSKWRPLTVKDSQQYRKTFHHFDFSKQSKRMQSKQLHSTMYAYTAEQTANKQFRISNNERKKSKKMQSHTHSFQSDSGHTHFVREKESTPEYDLSHCKESLVCPAMKEETTYHTFDVPQKLNRHDRSDPAWHTQLIYNDDVERVKPKIRNQINFALHTDRRNNDVHSTYPMRISLI